MDIQAFPRGYLALVQAVSMGQGLAQGSDYIQPTTEIFDLLASSKRRCFSMGPTIIGPGSTDLIPVPRGEMWRIRSIGAHTITNVGETFTNLYYWMRSPEVTSIFGPGDNRVPLSGAFNQVALNIGAIMCPNIHGPLLALPGSVFGYSSFGAVGNPTQTLVIVADVLTV